jgi:threonine/homoserine/homoserine lactone efflux protein
VGAIGQGISEVLTPAVGVAITVSAIIAVILMLFSQRARVNGPLFLLGWVVGLSTISVVIYVISDQSNASTSSTASDTISWLKIAFGLAFLLLAVRTYRNRPAPGAEPVMPKWMSGIDALTPGKAVGLGLLLSAVNPKNLVLTFGAATGLAQLGLSTSDVVVSLIVFVLIGSLTIAGPVVYYLLGGEHAKTELDQLKGWLTVHNAAVMAGVLLVLGADLIAKGLPPLTT